MSIPLYGVVNGAVRHAPQSGGMPTEPAILVLWDTAMNRSIQSHFFVLIALGQ
jgi:hypothetical protein